MGDVDVQPGGASLAYAGVEGSSWPPTPAYVCRPRLCGGRGYAKLILILIKQLAPCTRGPDTDMRLTLLGPGPPAGAYCTRVGLYWPGVVRTARDSDLRGVHPNVCQ